jgi:hypothetical protein
MCQHIPHKGKSKISMRILLTSTRGIKDVAIENGQVQQMKEQFFRPIERTSAYGVPVGHSVSLIYIAFMMALIHHNLRLYVFSSLIAEINFCWGIVNISQHEYVSFVSPQYCCQVSPGSNAKVPPIQFCCLRF